MNLHLWLLPPSLHPLRYRAGRGGVCRDGGSSEKPGIVFSFIWIANILPSFLFSFHHFIKFVSK